MARTALVTGASRGIGAAIATALAENGVHVLAPPRGVLDVSDPASTAAFAESPGAREVDILVNCAGINLLGRLEEVSELDWAKMLQVNLTAPRALIQAVVPGMRSRAWGRVVNISSIYALVTRERRASYSSTKAAVLGLTRAAAVELAPFGILVNAVCPGFVETALTRQNNTAEELADIAASVPLGRLAEPQDIASVVAFLCSEENRYMTGQALVVDGGFTCR